MKILFSRFSISSKIDKESSKISCEFLASICDRLKRSTAAGETIEVLLEILRLKLARDFSISRRSEKCTVRSINFVYWHTVGNCRNYRRFNRNPLNIFSTLLSNKFQRQIPIHWKLTSHSSFNVHFLEFSQRDFSKRFLKEMSCNWFGNKKGKSMR